MTQALHPDKQRALKRIFQTKKRQATPRVRKRYVTPVQEHEVGTLVDRIAATNHAGLRRHAQYFRARGG